MREAEWLIGPVSSGEGMRQVGAALHDLCQPLTILRCRLELAGLTGTPEAYREAVSRGMAECERLVKVVDSMREIVGSATCAATERDQEAKGAR
jgi:hypothetical protein